MRSNRFAAAARLLAAVATCGAAAASAQGTLADLSLEQLSNIQVTSMGKRVQRLAEVPGSVYVIGQEDIRRSGATSLPEVLRLAPNLHVARADANQYAIAARGFNSVLANKMLVLIDGRTVYSPLFSGVFWEAQDLPLQDIERIEVLSGASGTLYGSNAFNGVINVITRHAGETPGWLATLAAGSEDRVASLRYGHTTDAGLSWRLYARHAGRDASELGSGTAVRDASSRKTVGFRMDRPGKGSELTVQGDAYEGSIDQAPSARRIAGANLLARYGFDLGDGGRAQLQGFYDRSERRQPGVIDNTLDTFDVDFQHVLRPRDGHELLWGTGLRWLDDRVTNLTPAVLAFRPADRRLRLWNVFAQDEIALGPKFKLTLGLKAEHNDYTGLEWLPNARLAWDVAPRHLLWTALSRTIRAPSRVDRELFVTGAASLAGPDFRSEVAKVFEVGYRAQPRESLSYSLTLYHHRFDRLRSTDIVPGGTSINNNFEGHLTGIETWGRWRLAEGWRATASYVHERQRIAPAAGTAPFGGTAQLGNDPRYRAGLGLSWDIRSNMELDMQLRRVGALPNPNVPAYTAVDARFGWRLNPAFELSVTARNLTDSAHAEWGNAINRAEMRRAIILKATWRL
ncbi:TonB-dependent receptor plug domain-containing protein [Ramlibacter sp.]|uniref:TonB-dependent receptor plug domain-containing protein n=1 Tax=Ramlibacter sp. TaxID=1917967 RepID=UPI003D09A60A